MIYFDHAATGFPKSEAVISAVANAMRISGSAGRGSHGYAEKSGELLYECRTALADEFGAQPENCVLTKNCTESLCIAVKGFIMRNKGKCVVVAGDFDHNSVTRPLYAMEKAGKARIKRFTPSLESDGETLERFEKAVSGGASLAVITHASNVCGRIFPLREMYSAAARRGVTVIVDAAQTAGHIPIRLDEDCADILCLPGHKGLYGPSGTGAMIFRSGFDKLPDALLEGGTGIRSIERSMPPLPPERYEAGTVNTPAFAGLAQALKERISPEPDGYRTDGEDEIYRFLIEELGKTDGIRLIGAPKSGNTEKWTKILLLTRKGESSEQTARYLAEKGFAVRGGLHCAPGAHRRLGTLGSGAVRISVGRGNTIRQAEELISALRGG